MTLHSSFPSEENPFYVLRRRTNGCVDVEREGFLISPLSSGTPRAQDKGISMIVIQSNGSIGRTPARESTSNPRIRGPIPGNIKNHTLVSYNTSSTGHNSFSFNDVSLIKADPLLLEHASSIHRAQALGWLTPGEWSSRVPDDDHDVWHYHRPWSPEYPAAWIVGDASAFTTPRIELEMAFGMPEFRKARSEVRRRLPKAVNRHDNKHHAVHARCHRPEDVEELVRAIGHWNAPWKKTVPRYRLVVQGTLVCLLREGRRNQVSNPQNILLNRRPNML